MAAKVMVSPTMNEFWIFLSMLRVNVDGDIVGYFSDTIYCFSQRQRKSTNYGFSATPLM